MSKSKGKRDGKQREREEKMLEQIRKGKVTRIAFEERKKKLALPNRLNMKDSPEDEEEERQAMVENATKVYRKLLPNILKKLSRIKDPRRPNKIKHKHTVLLLYGILMFVQQVGSRREANRRVGRYRWKIENNILTEKHQGYEYEHCYSYTWDAMEGYHYLMKIGRLLNVIAANSELMIEKVKALGIRGFIAELKRATSSSRLDKDRVARVVSAKYQFRLAL